MYRNMDEAVNFHSSFLYHLANIFNGLQQLNLSKFPFFYASIPIEQLL